jgi:DNA-binding response OmpR family regulator
MDANKEIVYSILVIEDDERMAELISRGLTDFGYNVMRADDGTKGLRMALDNQYDLVITDILLPGMNGLDVCKQIKATDEQFPVIMLTALGTTNDKVEGFDAGADDYMVKPFEIRELNVRIRALLKRCASLPKNGVLNFADLELNRSTKIVKRGETELNLTPKEFNLLEYMMLNSNRVLSKGEIAEKVWDTTFDTGTNFIDVYISYLRRKVDKGFPRKLIHTRPGMGFILKEEDENTK